MAISKLIDKRKIPKSRRKLDELLDKQEKVALKRMMKRVKTA